MAALQQVVYIEHCFAVLILILNSTLTEPIQPGVTRGIPISAEMSDDHEVVFGTFMCCGLHSLSMAVTLIDMVHE